MVWEETIQLVPYNPLQTMQVCSSLLESSLRPNSFLKLYEDIIFITWLTLFSECWCSGRLYILFEDIS